MQITAKVRKAMHANPHGITPIILDTEIITNLMSRVAPYAEKLFHINLPNSLVALVPI